MIEHDNTTIARPPACVTKDIQFFSDPALLEHKPSVNKYRTRFEEAEIKYLYWDMECINLLYKKQDSTVTFKIVCKALTKGNTMYSKEHTINIASSEISKIIGHSFGNDAGGYWKADQYLWEVFIDGNAVLSKTIIIDKQGAVTPDSNPYFDVLETTLYNSLEEQKNNQQQYYKQFKSSETNIGIELLIKRKFPEGKRLEFIVNVIQANTGITYIAEKSEVFYPIVAVASTERTRLSYNTKMPACWQNGTYLFFVNFMGTNIAAGQFTVGNEVIQGPISPLPIEMWQAAPTAITMQESAVESALAELNRLIGMQAIKSVLLENIEYLKFNKVRMQKGFADDGQLGLHSIFTGNPGTGKTTIVRLLGKIYKAMGVLSSGHVVEVTRADIIGEFIGQTAPKTKAAIEKARGGILFLDEVYALNRQGSNNDFGQEAIEIILKEMSDGPGNIAIIGAGYPEEVNMFLDSNPGLKSRFSRHFRFEDYLPDELMQIAALALQQEEAIMAEDAQAWLRKKLTALYRDRDRNFGNARLVFGIIDEAKKQMGIRLLKSGNIETLSKEELSRIGQADLEKVFAQEQQHSLRLSIDQEELDRTLAELEGMTGLEQIKQEIRNKVSLVQFYNDTGKDVLHKFSLHVVLTGNPGTGKTTLARILGRIYKALGLLERGHLVEVCRQDLVAGYVGQTAIKTSGAISRAMGGVLFIDEAYALTGGENDFGKEAVETILKTMEDQRGKFSVIAAGYPDNMNEFIHSNPGLQSRFDTTYQLPDYSSDELFLIAEKQLTVQDLKLMPEAAQHLKAYLQEAYETRNSYFGNARFVRQAVDAVVTAQNLRMALVPPDRRTAEMLQQIVLADVKQLAVIKSASRPTIGFKINN